MLTGKTSVYIDTTKSDDDPADKEDNQDSDKKTSQTKPLDDAELEVQTSKKKKKLDRSQYGRFIINFGKLKN